MSVDDDAFWYVEDGRIEFEWGSSGSVATWRSGISNIKLQVFHIEVSSQNFIFFKYVVRVSMYL